MGKTAVITGASGLIGSQCVDFFTAKGFDVVGIDNNMRRYFFGEEASTLPTKNLLENRYLNYKCLDIDIRDLNSLEGVFEPLNVDIIIHTAAQPSHDWAAKEPLTDFTVNALGTVNLLEVYRKYCPKAAFIFTSTNKVYGDRPNTLPLEELETRYEFKFNDGSLGSICEKMSIDDCKHSIFGASKVAADILVQEYGKYFGLNTVVFRGGCLTGPNHKGAKLHGFLSYLIKCILNDKSYTIFGYKGKQVRDNIHSWDLVNMFWHYYQAPRQGEVYNAGGGRENSISVLEAIDKINYIAGTNWDKFTISEENRIGDHIWYITNYSKFKEHYPEWEIKHSLDNTIEEIINNEKSKN